MKIGILTILITLSFAGILFAELPINGFEFSPFVYFEKQLYSTLNIKHESNIDIFRYKEMEIITSDHLAMGCKIQRSNFFTVVNYKISVNDEKFTPDYFDLNLGLSHKFITVYTGKVFTLKNGEHTMLENMYAGLGSNWNNKRIYTMSNLQFIDGNYKTCSDEKKSFSTVALDLQLSYAYKKLYPYTSFSISDLHYQIVVGIALLNPPNIRSNIESVINRRVVGASYDKPNIYLYPNEQCDVEVYLQPNGKIKKSIPEYNDGWKVNVKPTGLIDDKYDFLFYEAEVDVKIPSNGWCIAMDEFNSFFRTILLEYGLNETEITDFIEYWSKRLEGSDQYCVYPLVNNDLNDVCPISIKPQPDNMLRLCFIFVPVEQYKSLEKPGIPEFSRKGFEVVEWGGILKE